MRRFPREWLDDLYQRADIVQVVSGYVTLKKNGRNYWGLCPFHHEKSPSFSVTPDLNLYYCFGCKAGGNVVQFVMEMEKLTYQEAIEHLADQFHIPIPEMTEDPQYEARRNQRDRLLAANKEAAQFYHQLLWSPQGKQGLSYLYDRGLTDKVIRRFGLGVSPDDWDVLRRRLNSLSFTDTEIIQAGLAVQKDGQAQPRDFFRNRVMFPIIDQFGNVLAFGGRSMDGSQPKYLNTGDTPIFNKRKGVFAANLLRRERQLKRVILVEGYMDVIQLNQAGIPGVAATLGTSLTEEQARLLSRFAPEIWICYDGDEPGQHAIEKALDIFALAKVPAKALYLPGGLDPDEFIRGKGTDAFNELSPLSPPRFRLMRLEKESDFNNDDGRIKYVKSACELIRGVRDPVEIEVYIRDISRKSGFDREIIVAQLGIRPERVQEQSGERQKSYPRQRQEQNTKNISKSEEELVTILAQGPLPDDMIRFTDFSNELLRSVAEKLQNGVSAPEILADSSDADRELICGLFTNQTYDSEDERVRAAGDCLKRLRKQRLTRQYDQLIVDIGNTTDEETRVSLMQQAKELQNAIAAIGR